MLLKIYDYDNYIHFVNVDLIKHVEFIPRPNNMLVDDCDDYLYEIWFDDFSLIVREEVYKRLFVYFDDTDVFAYEDSFFNHKPPIIKRNEV